MEPIYHHLTKRELWDLAEIGRSALTIDTDEALKELLIRIGHLVPCEKILSGLGRIDPSGHFQEIIKIVNVSYPPGWMVLYLERDYAAIDPILRHHFGRFTSQLWSKTFQETTSQPEKEFIQQARSFDLSQGITIGIPCLRKRVGSLFSFSGRAMGEHSRHSRVLEHLTPHLHLALMRTLFPFSTAAPILSPREREILEWVKEGKTNLDISAILNISEQTVRFHLKNILVKFGALTRGHAVVQAMEQGLI